jgi:hypothetical protein
MARQAEQDERLAELCRREWADGEEPLRALYDAVVAADARFVAALRAADGTGPADTSPGRPAAGASPRWEPGGEEDGDGGDSDGDVIGDGGLYSPLSGAEDEPAFDPDGGSTAAAATTTHREGRNEAASRSPAAAAGGGGGTGWTAARRARFLKVYTGGAAGAGGAAAGGRAGLLRQLRRELGDVPAAALAAYADQMAHLRHVRRRRLALQVRRRLALQCACAA